MATTPVPIGGGGRARQSLVAPVHFASPVPPPRVPVSPVGASLQGLGNSVQSLGAAIKKNENAADGLNHAEMLAQYQTAAARRVAELDPSSPGYTTQVREAYAETGADALEGADFNSRQNHERFRVALLAHTEGGVRAAVDTSTEYLRARAGAEADQLMAVGLGGIRENPQDIVEIITQVERDAALLAPALTADQLTNLISKFSQEAIIAQVEGFARRGDFDSAASALGDADKLGLLAPGTVRALRSQVREEQSIQRTAQLLGSAGANHRSCKHGTANRGGGFSPARVRRWGLSEPAR